MDSELLANCQLLFGSGRTRANSIGCDFRAREAEPSDALRQQGAALVFMAHTSLARGGGGERRPSARGQQSDPLAFVLAGMGNPVRGERWSSSVRGGTLM